MQVNKKMKNELHFPYTVVLAFCFSCFAAGLANANVGPEDGTCADGTDPFDTTALREIVAFLASDDLAGRAPGTPGDEAARQFIEDRFRCLGLAPPEEGGSYQTSFVNSARRRTANVVAVVPGSDPVKAAEIIVVGAHHDHLGLREGRVYNGANDNASGIAALLAMGKAIRQSEQPPQRTIVFVAFASEEEDLGGSRLFVAQPPGGLSIDNVVYMINLDMVGYSPDGSIRAGGAWAGTPARAELEALAGGTSLRVEIGARVDSDDQVPFCRAGIPFVYFAIDTDDDRCYHRSCDDTDRVNYEYLSAVSELSFDLLAGLADSDVDLLAARNDIGCGFAENGGGTR